MTFLMHQNNRLTKVKKYKMKKLLLSSMFLLTGLALSAQQSPVMAKKDPAQMEQKRAEKLKMMQTDLQLTDAQVVKIKALQNKKMEERRRNAPQLQAERKAKMEAMKAKKQQYDNEMKQILTPAQFEKWQTQQKERMQARKGKMQHRPMKQMP